MHNDTVRMVAGERGFRVTTSSELYSGLTMEHCFTYNGYII